MGGERRSKAEKSDWPEDGHGPPVWNEEGTEVISNPFEEWVAKHKLCTRCAGQGDCCRGCSGLARDYPELFGSCTLPPVTCPECLGSGNVEDQVHGRAVKMKLVKA